MDHDTKQGMFGKYYVVLIDGEWHVLFEPDHLKRHFLSVARFQDEDRATAYVDMENMTIDDGEFPVDYEDVHAVPDLSKAGPIKALQVIPPTKVIPDIERNMSDFEGEVLADLPGLMKDYPYGVSADEIKEYYGVNWARATAIMRTLSARKLAKKVHWPDEGDATNRLVPLDYERPPMRVNEEQRALLVVLKKMATGDSVTISQTAIGKAAGIDPNKVERMLFRLSDMGLLEPLQLRAGSVIPAAYRITDGAKKLCVKSLD